MTSHQRIIIIIVELLLLCELGFTSVEFYQDQHPMRKSLNSLSKDVYRTRFHPDYFNSQSIKSFLVCYEETGDKLNLLNTDVQTLQSRIACLDNILPALAPSGLVSEFQRATELRQQLVSKLVGLPPFDSGPHILLLLNKKLRHQLADLIINNLHGYTRELEKPQDEQFSQISEIYFPILEKTFYNAMKEALISKNEGTIKVLGKAFLRKRIIIQFAQLLQSPDAKEREAVEHILKRLFKLALVKQKFSILNTFVTILQNGFFDIQEHKDEISLRPIQNLLSLLSYFSQSVWMISELNEKFFLIIQRQFLPLIQLDHTKFETIAKAYFELLFVVLKNSKDLEQDFWHQNWSNNLIKQLVPILRSPSKLNPNNAKLLIFLTLLSIELLDVQAHSQLFSLLLKFVRSPTGLFLQVPFLKAIGKWKSIVHLGLKELKNKPISAAKTLSTPETCSPKPSTRKELFNTIAHTIFCWSLEPTTSPLMEEELLSELATSFLKSKYIKKDVLLSAYFDFTSVRVEPTTKNSASSSASLGFQLEQAEPTTEEKVKVNKLKSNVNILNIDHFQVDRLSLIKYQMTMILSTIVIMLILTIITGSNLLKLI